MYNICSSSFITGMLQWIRFRLPEQQLLFCTSRSKHQALIRYYTWNHVLTNLLISPGIFAWAQQSYMLSMVDWIGKAAASHIFPTQLGILRATHRGVKQRWYLNLEQKTLHTSPETHQIILKNPAQALSKSGWRAGGRAHDNLLILAVNYQQSHHNRTQKHTEANPQQQKQQNSLTQNSSSQGGLIWCVPKCEKSPDSGNCLGGRIRQRKSSTHARALARSLPPSLP